MHFFKVYESCVLTAMQQVNLYLQQCELRNWYDYTILGTLNIKTDKFDYNVKEPEEWDILTKRADINNMLTNYVSAENFNKKKKWLLEAIMSSNWAYAESLCRDLSGIEYTMGRKIDVADLNVPDINGETVINPGLSKVGIGPGLASGKTAYLVEVEFDS